MPNIVEDIRDDSGTVIRRRVSFVCNTPSRTKQAMKQECDINGIMKRYERTGVVSHLAHREAYFADVSEVPDFATALRVVQDADKMFSSLPAAIRKEFENDPIKYVEFCMTPGNEERMRELGLAEPLPVVPVHRVEVVNPNPVSTGGNNASS